MVLRKKFAFYPFFAFSRAYFYNPNPQSHPHHHLSRDQSIRVDITTTLNSLILTHPRFKLKRRFPHPSSLAFQCNFA